MADTVNIVVCRVCTRRHVNSRRVLYKSSDHCKHEHCLLPVYCPCFRYLIAIALPAVSCMQLQMLMCAPRTFFIWLRALCDLPSTTHNIHKINTFHICYLLIMPLLLLHNYPKRILHQLLWLLHSWVNKAGWSLAKRSLRKVRYFQAIILKSCNSTNGLRHEVSLCQKLSCQESVNWQGLQLQDEAESDWHYMPSHEPAAALHSTPNQHKESKALCKV